MSPVARLFLMGGISLVAPACGSDPAPAGETDARLKRLATEVPGFVPLSRADLPRGAVSTKATVLVLKGPAIATLETRPSVRWEAAEGSSAVGVHLRDDAGETLFQKMSVENGMPYPSDAPALEPGRAYRLSLRVVTEKGPATLETPLRVATRDQVQAFERAVAAFLRLDPDLAPLAEAHLAIHGQYWGRAERSVRAFLATHPDDDLARATLDAIRARWGTGGSLPKK